MNDSDSWRTPPKLFDYYNKRFAFTLDPAATIDHHLTSRFYCDPADTPGMCVPGQLGYDGLAHSWESERVFLNPPYGRGQLDIWLKKAYQEATAEALVMCLIPVTPATQWWQTYVTKARVVEFLPKRVAFIDPNTNKPVKGTRFDSAVVLFY